MKEISCLSVFFCFVHAVQPAVQTYSDQTPLEIVPAASLSVPTTIRNVAPGVAKLSWASVPGEAYIVEYMSVLDASAWQTFSIVTATGSTARRSVITIPEQGFYRVMPAALFGTGQPISWSVSSPAVSSTSFCASIVEWLWENSTLIAGPACESMTNSFANAGTKMVSVTVRSTDGSFVSKQWAVVVTNSVSTNLIANPDFEAGSNGLPVAWFKGGYGTNSRVLTYPVPGVNGSSDKAVGVTISNYISGDAKWYFNDVPIRGGFQYRFSDWYISGVPTVITVRYTLTNGNYVYTDIAHPVASVMWQQVVIGFSTPANAVSLTIFHSLISNGSLSVDNAALVEIAPPLTPLAQWMASLDFDDGWEEGFTIARPKLEKAGFRATYYIIAGVLEFENYASWQEVLDAEAAGHEIGAHTVTHPYLTTLTPADREFEINMCAYMLRAGGVQRVITAFAYPFGDYNSDVKQSTQDAGYILGRSSDGGFNVKGSTDFFALKRQGILTTTTIDQVKGWIDSAATNNQWLILVFHHVANSAPDNYTATPAFLEQVIDYLSLRHAKVVTATEGMRILTAP